MARLAKVNIRQRIRPKTLTSKSPYKAQKNETSEIVGTFWFLEEELSLDKVCFPWSSVFFVLDYDVIFTFHQECLLIYLFNRLVRLQERWRLKVQQAPHFMVRPREPSSRNARCKIKDDSICQGIRRTTSLI